MAEEQKTFEDNLGALEQIVARLERGDVPLEEAMTQFQQGVQLAKTLDSTLKNAEEAVAQVLTADGELKAFEPDKQS